MSFCAFLALLTLVFTAAGGAENPAREDNGLPAPQWIGSFEIDGKAGLKWVHSTRYAAISINRRREAPGETFRQVAEVRENHYFDEDVLPGETYVYRLVAVGPSGEKSPPSRDQVFTRAPLAQPLASAQWEGYLLLERGVGLKWRHNQAEQVVAYNLYRRKSAEEQFQLVGATATSSFLDATVEPGEEYEYVLTVLDGNFVESGFSESLPVTVPAQRAPLPKEDVVEWRPRRTRLVKLVEGGSVAFFRPADVALGPKTGKVYVSDSGNHLIQAFAADGSHMATFGEAKDGAVLPGNLLGLAVDGDETIYAVHSRDSALAVMSSAGAVLSHMQLRPFFGGDDLGIIDVAVAADGRVFVVDNYNNRVLVLGDGKDFRFFGEAGFQGGQFSAPTFCTIDADGFLYVSDALNGRVQVFDSRGDFVRSFGQYRKGEGGLARPKGIAVNGRGEVYVADSWQNVIQVFDGEGKFLAVLSDEGGRPLDLGSPNGIALGRANRIYIVERLSNRLQIREILDED